MTDIYDVSTLDGRRYAMFGRAIEPATPATSSSKPAVEKPDPAVPEDRTAVLQRNLDRATLDLSSARRTLRTYRRGMRGLVASVAVHGLMALAGLVTAIVSSVASVDLTAAVAWLLAFGWPMTVASVVGLVTWIRLYRIKYEWRKKDSYTYTSYVLDTKHYIDPQHNVDIAQLQYASALRKLTEHAG